MAGKNGSEKLGKLVEAGLSVAKIAQAKAEEALRDVVHISEVQRNQMRDLFDEAAKKSRASTEVLIKTLRKEIENQLKSANMISKEEFAKFSDRLSALSQDIGKMSSLRDEVSKLTDMVNSLMRTISKSEPAGKEKTGEPEAGASSSGTTSSPAPRRRTSQTLAKRPPAPPKSKEAAERTGRVSSRTSRAKPRSTAAPMMPKSEAAPNEATGDTEN
ncbi:MAG: hypothetical protein EPN30_10230 [Actinomycetota bacterium]|nr:MAG: hypothetical protein EPN30_10230 [Actinomycetota bacterium]